uniref:Uncharacterized protein n=1 Tax=Octopus bimaculoides TaxID=37653 RepID=A0A0L8HHZ9_OCTBM
MKSIQNKKCTTYRKWKLFYGSITKIFSCIKHETRQLLLTHLHTRTNKRARKHTYTHSLADFRPLLIFCSIRPTFKHEKVTKFVLLQPKF